MKIKEIGSPLCGICGQIMTYDKSKNKLFCPNIDHESANSNILQESLFCPICYAPIMHINSSLFSCSNPHCISFKIIPIKEEDRKDCGQFTHFLSHKGFIIFGYRIDSQQHKNILINEPVIFYKLAIEAWNYRNPGNLILAPKNI